MKTIHFVLRGYPNPFILSVVLFLTACGTMDVGMEHTPTPNYVKSTAAAVGVEDVSSANEAQASATSEPKTPLEASAAPALAMATIEPTSRPTRPGAAEPGPLPALIAQVPLAPSGAALRDLLLDGVADRLYVSDTAGQLHILDAGTYAELATLPAVGDLALDAVHSRLYVSPLNVAGSRYDGGDVTVVDTASLTVLGTISPGGPVALDTARNRVYVGNRVELTAPEGTPGVRVYDGATLEKLGEVPHPGRPVYNPLRDELYIVARTVHVVDADTLQVIGDLLPDVTAQPPFYGTLIADDAYIFPDRNLLVVTMWILIAGGHGPGPDPQPRFFNATTLDELGDLTEVPAIEHGCNGRVILARPVDGRVYRGKHFFTYFELNNLLVYDLNGTLEDWRDGLGLGITNPNTGQMYVGDLVLDLRTLTPLGSIPVSIDCIYSLDAEAGHIYARQGGNLVVLSERGGQPEPPSPPGDAGPLPPELITFILPSPDYPADRTLFLGTGDAVRTQKLYRSVDGGQTWAQLHGGLPEEGHLSLDLAISPNFADDHTLFVGGHYGYAQGVGVYRSTDGGDTWQPMWNGLTHLRVYDVVLSPDYANDGTVLAYADYSGLLAPLEDVEGRSVFRSADRGLNWTLEVSAAWGEDPPPPPEELMPPGPPSLAVRLRAQCDYDHNRDEYFCRVERMADDGRRWEPVLVIHPPAAAHHQDLVILLSPNFTDDGTVYLLSEYDLFRSTDGGDTWERWPDQRLVGRDRDRRLTVGAVSPLLEDGSYRLFVGTAAGEFWSLDPMALAWQPAAATTLTPPAYPPPHATSTPAPPTGSYRPEGDLHQLGDDHKGVSLRLQGLVRPSHSPSTLLRTGLHRPVDSAGTHGFQLHDTLIENAFDDLLSQDRNLGVLAGPDNPPVRSPGRPDFLGF